MLRRLALAADEPAGQLVAAMSTGRTVRRFAADGSQLGEFATRSSATRPTGGCSAGSRSDAEPTGVDYDAAGRLLVHALGQVKTLTALGAVESAIGIGLGGRSRRRGWSATRACGNSAAAG